MNLGSKILLVVCCASLLLPGCSKRPSVQPQPHARESSSSTPVSAASAAKIDPCWLLTSEEIESVQGEPVQATSPIVRDDGTFVVAQCYFGLPTSANSISLVLTTRGKNPGAQDPKDFWKKTFHREEDSTKSGEGEESEEEKSPPQRVADLGDEAFWMGTQISTALYVLKGDSYLRISVGGAGDQASKLEKSKKLAQFALKRF